MKTLNKRSFKQTSSIINRLRLIMIIIALFIIFCDVALYVASLGTLRGLTDLNTASNLLNLNSQSVEVLNTLQDNLEKINEKTNIKELRFTYNENYKVLDKLIKDSIKQASEYDEIVLTLNETKSLFDQTDIQFRNIFSKLETSAQLKQKVMHEIPSDIIVTKQLVMDTKEMFRQAQIKLKKKTDDKFSSIFKDRFKPLLVTNGFSLILFVFVITFGLAISKKLGKSIANLLNATDSVAQGNLNYKLNVIDKDEIGRLTDAFNNMTLSLKTGQDSLNLAMDKTQRLQTITALFSEALTLEQVYQIIFKQAFEVLGAVSAALVLVSEDRNFLELKRAEGYSADVLEKWKKLPISADTPSAKVIRHKQPLYIHKDEYSSFRDINPDKDFNFRSNTIASFPLMISSEAFGAITFHFPEKINHGVEEKEFMMALARQCAQAIYRSQLYDNAKKAIEARDEFLSIASHELRTPLTPLKLQVQKVIRMIDKNEDANINPARLKMVAKTAERQINRLTKLIDNLLDISRINMGNLTLDKTNFSLEEMINEVLRHYSKLLNETNAVINLNVIKDAVGNWDKVRIEQVFINLLTNAIKYAPGKPIHISINNENHIAKLIVEDEGSGISPQDHERIFNRFERGNSAENIGGLGLGLYISRQIIQAHNGKIYVDNTLTKGSAFVVELPVDEDIKN